MKFPSFIFLINIFIYSFYALPMDPLKSVREFESEMDRVNPVIIQGGLEMKKALIDWCCQEYLGFKPDQYVNYKFQEDATIPTIPFFLNKTYINANDYAILWPQLQSLDHSIIKALLDLKNGVTITDKEITAQLESQKLPTKTSDFKKIKLFQSLSYLLDAAAVWNSNGKIRLIDPLSGKLIRSFSKPLSPIAVEKLVKPH